ncbi:uncharacterized protein LODBEIA_P58970 [Lodderomyces beijingensis]|uniref:Exocyst complex protein EXO70 n=1 Tax=Lodderomyces beijingensis TaxID=1775926 RepID=A0ABP0ZV99_9ASCO
MAYKVDIDDADVQVLSDNLIKSKELFESINKSLLKISSKTQTAHTTIKPVLTKVNKLYESKRDVEDGLSLLSEVNESVSQINDFENMLNNKIEVLGLSKYMTTLKQSRGLMTEIRPRFKQFKGIIRNFDNLLERAELKVQSHIDTVLNLPADKLVEKRNDVKVIFDYFAKQRNEQQVKGIYIDKRGRQLSLRLKAVEQSLRPSVIDEHYEKQQNGINKYTDAVVDAIAQEVYVLKECQLPQSMIGPISDFAFVDYNQVLIILSQQIQMQQSRNETNLILLEVIDNVLKMEQALKSRYNVSNTAFSKHIITFNILGSAIFPNFIRQVDAKFTTLNQFNEASTHQLTADAISVARRMCEFKQPLLNLISTHTAGDWMNPQPELSYVKIYTSLILNATPNNSPEYMLSSYFSDIIDCITINLQIGLDKQARQAASSGDNQRAMKKSAQGFLLMRNLYMIETIVNRSPDLHGILGTTGQERIAKLKNKFMKLFLEDFSFASYIIIKGMTQTAVSSTAQGGASGGGVGGVSTANSASANNTTLSINSHQVATNLTSKEKENVKDIFKRFNENFEDALATYQTFNFGDQNLRQTMATEVRKLILNVYFKLYDKYGHSDFTKSKSKYVKWDKQEFEKLLNDKL